MKTNVAQGEMLKKGDVELASWPAPLRPATAAGKVQEVEGRVAMSDLIKGEPVLLAKLAPEGSSPGLASRIDPGMRAMTIRVNEVISVAGFLLPMSRVDVLATSDVDDAGGGGGPSASWSFKTSRSSPWVRGWRAETQRRKRFRS